MKSTCHSVTQSNFVPQVESQLCLHSMKYFRYSLPGREKISVVFNFICLFVTPSSLFVAPIKHSEHKYYSHTTQANMTLSIQRTSHIIVTTAQTFKLALTACQCIVTKTIIDTSDNKIVC